MGFECQSCSGQKCLLLFIFITRYFYLKGRAIRNLERRISSLNKIQ
jgi:hypothetical protein